MSDRFLSRARAKQAKLGLEIAALSNYIPSSTSSKRELTLWYAERVRALSSMLTFVDETYDKLYDAKEGEDV